MPKQNRVTPYGDLIATSARGTFMGNRGILHDAQQTITMPYAHKAWIICKLSFKGRKRPIMAPGKYTELFFLDEATALAAGHRPCFECRRPAATAFREAWAAGRALTTLPSTKDMDNVLQAERLTGGWYKRNKRKRTYTAVIDTLPNGTFIECGGDPFLVWDEELYAWSSAGYTSQQPRPAGEEVSVLTPSSIVGALAHGYIPTLHPSAGIEDIALL